ncbi:protein kinase [Amycolatopsis umgeniensis]|uniref:Serine/threonine protein kinase n=1 Tax=Amycolatopsis umgeniensis TaxID=336628 RepID=A0A841BAW7_9PSEU|nr:protein kinase [Amycolatopsis umgeniensis]MBB5856457.1 serine/threonine protein kinase [Amycolatopsis umgeniensis]
MSSPDSWNDFLASLQLGQYQLHNYLGGGQFGRVFEASHVSSGDRVAVKVLLPNSELPAIAEFDRERSLLSLLHKSSNVVDLVDSGSEKVELQYGASGALLIDLKYHVLELSNECLEVLVLCRDKITWVERLTLWRGVILGVHQMHLKQIVHRDMKSENCLLFVKPKNITDCKVGDLGRARDLREEAIVRPEDYFVGRGDMRFAPPEFVFAQGEDSPRAHMLADLYGLGSILFELGTGQALTSLTLAPTRSQVTHAFMERQQGRIVDLSSVRKNYKLAFEIFEEELPASLKQHGAALIRQLCDPVPSERLPKKGISLDGGNLSGLEWLLRRTDILIRTVKTEKVKSRRSSLRGVS